MSEILIENGKLKAKVDIGKYDDSLLTMRNGYQWTGQPINPELAIIIIDALSAYLDSRTNAE